MSHSVKIPFGINTLVVGSLSIDTVKLRVGDNFPIEAFSTCVVESGYMDVEITTAFKSGYMIKYTGISGNDSRKRIQLIGSFLKTHAQRQLDEKYEWLKFFK